MKRDPNTKISWKRLFKKFSFFKAYQHFIQIQIKSATEEIHEKWKGYVESKIRRLLSNLENYNKNNYDCLEYRPWPKAYQLPVDPNYPFQVNDTYYFGIRIKNNPNLGDIKE